MKKPSEEAKRRYADYIKDHRTAIDAALEKEKKTIELIAAGGPGVGYQRLALADSDLDLVASYLLMNSLSVSFLGVKNEAYLNEARKCLYKTIIALEEIVSPSIDAPFSDYEQGLASIETFPDEGRYNLLCKIGFSLDSIQEGFGENSKWKWSFVELEGRFAAVTKNLLNLKTLIAGMDPRSPGYSATACPPVHGQGAAAAGRGPLPREVRAVHPARRRHQGRDQLSPCPAQAARGPRRGRPGGSGQEEGRHLAHQDGERSQEGRGKRQEMTGGSRRLSYAPASFRSCRESAGNSSPIVVSTMELPAPA